MPETKSEKTCVGRVIPGGSYGAFHAHICGRTAKVTGSDGKPYCGIHDPAKGQARRAERTAQYEAEAYARLQRELAYKRQQAKAALFDELVAALEATLPATEDYTGPGHVEAYNLSRTILEKAKAVA